MKKVKVDKLWLGLFSFFVSLTIGLSLITAKTTNLPFAWALLIWASIFFIASIGIMRPVREGVLSRMGRRIRVIKEGPYLRFLGFDKVTVFSLELRETTIPSEEKEQTDKDAYTKDENYLLPVMVVIWKVKDPMKFIEVTSIIDSAIYNVVMALTRLYIAEKPMQESLTDGKRDLLKILNEGMPDIKKPSKRHQRGLKALEKQWGIEIVTTLIKDIDPIPPTKEAMNKKAAAVFNQKTTEIDAEAAKIKVMKETAAERFRLEETAKGTKATLMAQIEADAKGFTIKRAALGLDEEQYAQLLVAYRATETLGGGQATKWILPLQGGTLLEMFNQFFAARKSN